MQMGIPSITDSVQTFKELPPGAKRRKTVGRVRVGIVGEEPTHGNGERAAADSDAEPAFTRGVRCGLLQHWH